MDNVHPLKTYRKSHSPKLSQRHLAKLLGVSRTTVARWETGAQKLDQDLIQRVAEMTGIAPADLRPDLAALLRTEAAE